MKELNLSILKRRHLHWSKRYHFFKPLDQSRAYIITIHHQHLTISQSSSFTFLSTLSLTPTDTSLLNLQQVNPCRRHFITQAIQNHDSNNITHMKPNTSKFTTNLNLAIATKTHKSVASNKAIPIGLDAITFM